mmetsp:Transcript_20574/g.31370  ORF Transcript_20574/g.31370 Transcript_20574/m.31370 type:complete len:233 (-) Transcript_20574:785-1483(-)
MYKCDKRLSKSVCYAADGSHNRYARPDDDSSSICPLPLEEQRVLRKRSILRILKGFEMNPAPPASFAFASNASMACAVTKTTKGESFPSRAAIVRHASRPSIMGISMSIKTTSYFLTAVALQASFPFPTISMRLIPKRDRVFERTFWFTALSSAIKTCSDSYVISSNFCCPCRLLPCSAHPSAFSPGIISSGSLSSSGERFSNEFLALILATTSAIAPKRMDGNTRNRCRTL